METNLEHTRNHSDGKLVKVVLFGPESTGKTTLSKQLASYYETLWVPEYMREYLNEKWDKKKESISQEDLLPIAEGQLRIERETAEKVEKLLICDTNLLELKVYSEYYYDGFCPNFIQFEATKDKYDIYLLTYIDVPWEEDRLRDRPHNREEMFNLFEAELKKHDFPYVILKGNKEKRLQEAIAHIDKLL